VYKVLKIFKSAIAHRSQTTQTINNT